VPQCRIAGDAGECKSPRAIYAVLSRLFVASQSCVTAVSRLQLCDRPAPFIMAALRSRCGHHIFALWFLSFYLFSSPNLSGRRLDVYHTSTHVVALVRI